MTLLAATDLIASRFFSGPSPVVRGSSFDLTIGSIFNHEGKKMVDGPFLLKAGHMVQVVSAELFDLPSDVTGHVTYKTALTKEGIWALTVGIIDPGWKGPISTTLLNFSKVDYAIATGDTFLRVSFFEHKPVQHLTLPSCPSPTEYLGAVQKTAMSRFSPTFLNKDEIARNAGDAVLERIRREALVWLALIALLFTVLQIVPEFVRHAFLPSPASIEDLSSIRAQIAKLEARLLEFPRSGIAAPVPGPSAPAPSPP